MHFEPHMITDGTSGAKVTKAWANSPHAWCVTDLFLAAMEKYYSHAVYVCVSAAKQSTMMTRDLVSKIKK